MKTKEGSKKGKKGKKGKKLFLFSLPFLPFLLPSLSHLHRSKFFRWRVLDEDARQYAEAMAK